MGLFKNKDNNIEIKREKTYLANMDGDAYFSLTNSTFIGKFDEEQKKALAFAMEHDLPHQAYAYEELPAKYMECINEYLSRASWYEPTPLDIWKIVNSGLCYEQFEVVIEALTHNLKMVDEIPVIRTFEHDVLAMVKTVFIRTNKNLCKSVTPTMDREDFLRKCKKIIEKQDKALEQNLKMDKYRSKFLEKLLS